MSLVGLMILTLAVLGVTITCSICYDRADDDLDIYTLTEYQWVVLSSSLTAKTNSTARCRQFELTKIVPV